MSTESEEQLKSDFVPVGHKKFIVKIMVTKKGKQKRTPQRKTIGRSGKSAPPLQRLHQEMDGRLKEIKQHKNKIEELTKSAIEELKRIHDLQKRAKNFQSKDQQIKATASGINNNHRFKLDYEMTNLKMIKKILTLATPAEAAEHTPKNKTKSQKKPKKNVRESIRITKILIIEDDLTTIKIVKHILEQHNFEVAFATEAEEGLKKAFKEKPDLILLDIMLPGMDGFQMLSKLQVSDETSRIPVVILSSLSGEKDILKGLERGATDYILKPFSPQILLFKIKKIMSLKNEHFDSDCHV